jgi:Tol biopolymer transport system component
MRRSDSRSIASLFLALVICAGCGAFSLGRSSGPLTDFATATSRFDGHSWSPDGHWLAAESSDDFITLFSADGQLVNTLSLGCYLGSGVEDMAWLPDGRLSCIVDKAPPLLGLFTLDQAGKVKDKTTIPVPINPHMVVLAMQWNPHASWLATIAFSQVGNIHIPTLYISDLAGHLLYAPMLLDADTLDWSHDGKTLALVQDNQETGNGNIELLHLQQTLAGTLTVTNTQQLVAGTASGENVEWSPSDRWLVCRHGSYESEDYLFLLATDGSGKQVKLTSSTTDGQLAFPSWSPDGKRLIVTRASDGALLSLDIAAVLKEKGVQP